MARQISINSYVDCEKEDFKKKGGETCRRRLIKVDLS